MSKLFSLFSDIIAKLNSKASLVDGKIPLSQLPDNIGGGEPVIISAVLNVDTLGLSEVSHSFEEISALLLEDKNVELWCMAFYSAGVDDAKAEWCKGDLTILDDERAAFHITCTQPLGDKCDYLVYFLADGATRVEQHNINTVGGGEDEVVWVTCFLDLSTMQILNMSHNYEELYAIMGKKVIKIAVAYGYGTCFGDLVVDNADGKRLMFQAMIRSDFGGLFGLFYFCINLSQYNEATVDTYLLDSTEITGGG